MQDIDFDELDRAVNSVIKPEADKGSVPVTTKDSDDRSVSVPERSAPSPATRRSSGRFMDVVHPSSDMRPSASVPERPSPEPTVEDSAPSTDSFQWPDPLDLPDTHTDVTADTKDEPQSSAESDTSRPPLESPFLSDAKVEKRPLGGPSLPETPEKKETPPLPETPETPTEPAPEPEPVELNEDILKLEEGDTPAALLTSEAPVDDIPAATSMPIVDAPVGPTSITQQYKEQPSTAEQPSGAIFDTEAYHQPLAHTPKKHSGILVVVWILALILIGGGMGAAVYFFVLPML